MGERALTFGLVLGGIAPCLSGVLAASSPGTYVDSLGHTIPFIFTTDAYRFFKFWMRLQGGDAFVAGAARVAGALVGSTEMKRLLAVVGVLHSAFEIVLIPSDLLQWCSSTGKFDAVALQRGALHLKREM